MKIAHVINSLGVGGAEKLLLDILPLLNKKGVKTDLILLSTDDSVFAKSISKDINFNVINLNFKSPYNPLVIIKLLKYTRHYDIIHSHLFPTFYYIAFIKLFNKRLKVILTEHVTNTFRSKYKLLKKLDAFVFSLYDIIISISDDVEKKLVSLNCSNKSILIPNGINTDLYRQAKPADLSVFNNNANINFIIQVSAFRPQKDQETLIKSLLYLPENVNLLLVGVGPEKQKHEMLVSKLKLQNRVFFLGARIDIPNLIKASDLVVLSTNYEGFGLAIVEGMAAGKPCIGSDVDGLREVLKNRGILFKKGDYIGLSEIIRKLLDSKDYYNNVALNCQKKSNSYDINKMVDSYINVYKKIFNNLCVE